jgi:hypothetical protein
LDDVGENKALEPQCQQQGRAITIEFTGPNSPQYSGKVLRKFATLYSKMRSMTYEGGIAPYLMHGLWTEAVKTEIDIENLLVSVNKNVAAYTNFYGKPLPGILNLKPFGSMALIGKRNKIQDKIKPTWKGCYVSG